jgi:putative ABC transport system permease protein
MLKRYQKDDFSTADAKEILSTIQAIFSVLNLVLVGIGAISLLVGGIGIMNIMYVSVTERTREIGVRRAIGALEKDILSQFLAESVMLSLSGGLIGLIISFIIVIFIRRFFPAEISLLSMFIAVFVSSAIGIFFGVFPARKAAKLSPIEAIRYE